MHIITRKRLIEFSKRHPDSEEALNRWYHIVKKSIYNSFAELRKTFPSVDRVGNFMIFNIGGNKYRLIVYIVFRTRKVYIRHILTHAEYDKKK